MIRIESESDGFWLTVEDDEDTGAPIKETAGLWRGQVIGYRLRITDPEQLYELVKNTLGPWIDEMRQGRAEFEMWKRSRHEEGDPGYDLSDPKHVDWHSVHSDLWDSREGK